MTKEDYKRFQGYFEDLTGKKADDNLEAFFSYVNTLYLRDIREATKQSLDLQNFMATKK